MERDEAKRLHPSTGSRKNKKLKAEQPTGWTLTDSQTRSGKTELTIHLQVETEKCTTALGSKVMRQPCRQEEEAGATEGESRNKREKKRQRSAKRHHARGQAWRGRMFRFFIGEVTQRRSCPTPGRGPSTGQPLKGTHTQEWTRRVYVRK